MYTYAPIEGIEFYDYMFRQHFKNTNVSVVLGNIVQICALVRAYVFQTQNL